MNQQAMDDVSLSWALSRHKQGRIFALALRHTVEQRQRDQLASMGITLPPLIPFGTECFAKLKRWHRHDWDHPFENIRVLGPAMGMSTTSKGYYTQSLTAGKFMRSTVVSKPPELIASDLSWTPTIWWWQLFAILHAGRWRRRSYSRCG